MLSEDEDLNVYTKFLHSLEELIDNDQLSFGHTQKSLKFYQKHFKRKQSNVLFVTMTQPNEPNMKVLI